MLSARARMSRWLSVAVTCFSVLLVCGSPVTAHAQSAAGDLIFTHEDLEFILQQIKYSEAHSESGDKGCDKLREVLPNLSVPLGLRTVDGSCNNLNPGREGFGQADLEFLELAPPHYPDAQKLTSPMGPNDVPGAQTSYRFGDKRTVQDSSARLISNLIVNQSVTNPAAVRTAEDEGGELLGPDIAGASQFLIPNTAPDEGLSAPFNAFMTFFGQFFDHGLDLVNKGGNGIVFMPLAQDDPLYDSGPDGIPGTPDDGQGNFMVMTRATTDSGPDGILGTADDGTGIINATTPHVDQQQTYTSHSSAQILLRHYEFGPCVGTAPTSATECLQSSGHLLDGFGNDRQLDTADDGGMSTWDTVQLQAKNKMGILLDDFDGASIPMFEADPYGMFIPGPQFGLPQLVTGTNPDGSPVLVEGNLADPVDASQALRIGHSFFLDVAHTANPGAFKGVGVEPDKAPDADSVINARIDMLSGQETRGVRAAPLPLASGQETYDDELLGAHFICGDGRCNENIALTTVHTLFHREHNRLVDIAKRQVLDRGDVAILNEWLGTPVSAIPMDWAAASAALSDISDGSLANQSATRHAIESLGLDWNGERIFQTARFGTEMQYNRVVFDEFVPTLSGLKDPFEGHHTNVSPSITAEFSQVVYRFGHSMLTETLNRYDADFQPITDAGALNLATASDQLGLFEAFLNPLALYNYDDALGQNTLSPEVATGAVVRGLTREVSNEIDEFITGGMQNNLVGLPLDIGALNIARGRDVGAPKLNAARRSFYAATMDTSLVPYISWVDYLDNLRHEASIVNFIAAYGTHPSLAGTDLIAGNNSDGEPSAVVDRRAAACTLVLSISSNPMYCEALGFHEEGFAASIPADAAAFMRSQGAWGVDMEGKPITGLEEIDFWNGGLAEERRPFTGYLGATHNFVFENQMEAAQIGDRFYYLFRTANIPLLDALESNTFSSLAMRNTDLGEYGAGTLPLGLFSVPNHNLEVEIGNQFGGDPEAESELMALVIRDPDFSTSNIQRVPDVTRFLQYTGGDHVVMGGSNQDDTLIGGIGDDSLWGRAGNDVIEGGDGADHIEGGPGHDIITDLSGPDVIEGGAGNDAIASGNEEDVIFGDSGDDFIVNASELGEIFGGTGNDWIRDGFHLGHIRGGHGNDWIENQGGGEDLFQGDLGRAPEAGEPTHKGHDVAWSFDGNNDWDMEGGDDVIHAGPGIDRVEGQQGFDWVSFALDGDGVDIDIDLTVFLRPTLPPSNATILDRYDRVEGVSGSSSPDILRGTSNLEAVAGGNAMAKSGSYADVDGNPVASDAEGAVFTPDGNHDGFALINGSDTLVPESERTVLPDHPNTFEQQHGFSGEIFLGGGGSDVIVSEGGVSDIVDGDSVLKVSIRTPDPAVRTGSANLAHQVAQNALTAAGAGYSDALTAFAVASAIAEISSTDLANVIANLTQLQSDAMLEVENAEAAVTSAEAAANDAQAALTLGHVNQGALESFVTNAEAAVVTASDNLSSEIGMVMTNNLAVLSTQAALGDAQAAVEGGEAAVVLAQADLAEAIATDQAAADAAVDALLALIACGGAATPSCAAQSSAFDLAVAVNVTTQTIVVQKHVGVTIAQDSLSELQGALASEQAIASAAIAAAIADSGLVAAAQDQLDSANAGLVAAQNAVIAGGVALGMLQDEANAALMTLASAQSDLQIAQIAAGDAQIALSTAELNHADAQANLAVTESDLMLAELVFDEAQVAAAAAEAALPTNINDTILVAGMTDVMDAVFKGLINPGELSIDRTIVDADPGQTETDSALFNGNLENFSVESDPGADGIAGNEDDPVFSADTIGDYNGDGYVEVVDTRPDGPGHEGRDLVRNTERLVFNDVTLIVPAGVAGSAGNINNLATAGTFGANVVVGSNTPFGEFVADATGIVDLDGVGPYSAIQYKWQIESEPGSGDYVYLIRTANTGDNYEVQGAVLELEPDLFGVAVRIEAIFLDDTGTLEIVRSAAYPVEFPEGFVPPPGEFLDIIIPANFLGAPDDISAAIDAADSIEAPLFANLSRDGLARFDITIPNVPLSLFENTGFPTPITGGDEVAVAANDIVLTFADAAGNVTGTFTPEIVAITNADGTVSQTAVNVLFSIRGADVAGLVVPPYAIATLTVGGVEVANATFFGDSSMLDATNVAVSLVNQSPVIPDPGEQVAAFVGTALSLPESFTFTNLTVEGGTPVFEFVIPRVDVVAFSNTDFGFEISESEKRLVGSGLTLRFEQAVPTPPSIETFTTGVARPTLVPIVEEGLVNQNLVDVVFTISGAEAESLINGLTWARLEAMGFGAENEVRSELVFGDSAGAPDGVVMLTTTAQFIAAEAFINANDLGDPLAIAEATENLMTANIAALSQNVPGGEQAALDLAGVPHANFIGNMADANRLINFENVSRLGLARFDFRLLDVPLALFMNNGFSVPVAAEDEIAIDRIGLMFTNPQNQIVGVFLPEIVAKVDALGVVDQEMVDILWSIRGANVAPLVVGLTNATVTLDGFPIQTIQLTGNSRDLDAQDVAEVASALAQQAATALASAVIAGDTAGTLVAQAELAIVMGAEVDSDFDGVPDVTDVCPLDASNDVDLDGICGATDNCPSVSNADQLDTDADGAGDVCDNCRYVRNGPDLPDAGGNSQRDTDADGFGNSCDPDLNNDGFVNFGDFVRFQAGWLGVEPDLDFNGDGVTNFGDLAIFSSYMFGEPGQAPTP